MSTRAARLDVTDIQRAQVIGTIRGESFQEVLHVALNEFIENHRAELDHSFRSVQRAVLSDDREALRGLLIASADRQARADTADIARLIDESREG